MTPSLNPYLSFRDTARSAMEFYHGIFGGELTVSTFGEANAEVDAAERDLVMHASLIADGVSIMAADTPSGMTYVTPQGISMSLTGSAADGDTLRRHWDALADGGTVTMPLAAAPWGDTFGMCTDRWGIAWMVNIAAS